MSEGYTTAIFVLKGSIKFEDGQIVNGVELAVMESQGSHLRFTALEDAVLLLLNGQPLIEPIVGYGPFVMNTEEQVTQAINDFKSGSFGRI